MKIIHTKFEGVILIEPKKHEDNRGFFSETFNKKKITKVINNDVALSESSFLQERVIDLFHDEIRLKNLQRKKQL